nr:NDP-sugar synthase [Salsipaludibacter albus]
MVVAGGRGTRLRPLTDDCPKPLLPLAGDPFLMGVVRRLAAVGVRRVFLVVGDDTTPFEVLRDPAGALGVEVVAVPEPEPLDTAGGVRSAIDRVDGPTFVLNGDVLTDLDFAAMADHHARTGADVTISLTLVEDTSSYGVCVREGTRIVDFVEKPAPGTLPGQRGVNAGTYLLQPDALDAFAQGRLSFERTVFPGILAAGGHVEGFASEGVWADLGTPSRYRHGHHLVLAGAMPWPSVAAVADRGDGVRVAADARVADDARLVGPCLVLDGARVASGAVVGPDVVVGREAVVGAEAVLQDTVLLDGAVVGDGVAAVGLVAGERSTVRAGAELGHGVVLGTGVVVDPTEVLGDDERRPQA